MPFGKKTKVNTYDGVNLGIIYSYLNLSDVLMLSVDFEECLKSAKKDDFIYLNRLMTLILIRLIVILKMVLEKMSKEDLLKLLKNLIKEDTM